MYICVRETMSCIVYRYYTHVHVFFVQVHHSVNTTFAFRQILLFFTFKMKYYSTRMNRVLHIPKISASSTNGTICKQKINSLLNFLVYAWPDIFMLALLNSSLKWCDPIRNVQNSTAAFRCCIVVSIDKTKLITSWFVPNKKEIDCYFKTPHKNNFTS